MKSSNHLLGTLKFKNEFLPIETLLTSIEHIEKILGKRISLTATKTMVIEDQLLNDIPNLTLTIKNEHNQIHWICVYKQLKFNFIFTISKPIIKIEFYTEKFNSNTWLQEWVYIFYRLQEYIEYGRIILPKLEYTSFDVKSISVEVEITNTCMEIYRRFTEQPFMNQIFSKFPECNLDDFSYSWGWIEEGPSNLISYKKNALLIHDFIVDFTPVGYIKWSLTEIAKKQSLLTITHKDLDLEDEINPIKAYFSYKNGWLYLLAKVKDLAENNYCTINFEKEIID